VETWVPRPDKNDEVAARAEAPKLQAVSGPGRPINWRRLIIATAVLHIGLAIAALVVFELILPAIGNTSTPSSTGFNYGKIFGSGLRPLGWYLAGILLALAPINFLVRVVGLWSGRGRR
jgi:hypothetical protein